MPASDTSDRREKNPVRQIWRDVEQQLIVMNGYWEFYLVHHLQYPQEEIEKFWEQRNGRREAGG